MRNFRFGSCADLHDPSAQRLECAAEPTHCRGFAALETNGCYLRGGWSSDRASERQVWAGTDARAAIKFDNCCAALVGSFEPLMTNSAPSTFRPEGRRAAVRCSREATDQFPQSGHSADDFEAVAGVGLLWVDNLSKFKLIKSTLNYLEVI